MNSPLYSYSEDPRYKDRALSNPSWSRILFNDRPIQASELIEIQTIQQRSLHRSLSAIYSNGTIIKGLYPLSFDKGSDIEVQITPGLFYIDGFCIEVEGKSFLVSKVDNHTIYLDVYEQIITENEDPNLRDTNTGGRLYGMEGAARLLWVATPVLNKETSYPIVFIKEGIISIPEKDINQESFIKDRFGDFVSEGLIVSASVVTKESTSIETTSNDSNDDLLLKQLKRLELEERRLRSILNSLKMEKDYLNSIPQFSLTHDLLKRKEDLDKIIIDKERELDSLKTSVLNTRSSLYLSTSTQTTDNLGRLFYKKIELSPGIAYVDNKKVTKESISSFIYKHELDTIRIDNQPFIYSRTNSFNSRSISYGTHLNNMGDCLAIGFTLYLNFKNVLWNNRYLYIRTSISFDKDIEVHSIDELAKYIAHSYSTDDPINDNQSFLCSDPADLSPYLLRYIIQSNLKFSVIGNTDIYIESNHASDKSIELETKTSNSLISFDKAKTLINHVDSKDRSYYLNKELASIHSISAVFRAVEIPITRSSKRSDLLPEDSVLNILSVKQEGVDYIEGRDYFLSLNSIDWSTSNESSTKPEYGTTYYVTFLYTKLVEGFSVSDGSIRFTLDKPENGSTFFVTYSYYKPLNKYLSLKASGDLSLDNEGLSLALLKIGSASIEVEAISNRRWTSEEIQRLKKELDSNRDSLILLSNQIRYGEDYTDLTPSDIDEEQSSYSINSSNGFFSSSLKRVDKEIESLVYTNSYLVEFYKSSGIKTNYLEVNRIGNDGYVAVSPSVVLINNDSSQSISHLGADLRRSWPVESKVRSYLEQKTQYILESGFTPSKEITSSRIRLELEVIGLVPRSSNYSIYIDGEKVLQRSYSLLPDSIVNSAGLISANSNGEIKIAIFIDVKVGIHSVEVRNISSSSSSFFSVLDVKEATDYVTSYNTWNDVPLEIKAKVRPRFPANKGQEFLAPIIQEFSISEEHISIAEIDIDIKGKAQVVLGRVVDNQVLPSILAKFEKGDEKRFYLTNPITLERGKYYIGILPIDRDIEIPIEKLNERGIDSSLIIIEKKESLQISDGYISRYMGEVTLVFDLYKALFTRERIVDLHPIELSPLSKAFSLNIRPSLLNVATVRFFYRDTNSGDYIPIEPFQLYPVHISQPTTLELRAVMIGTKNVSPIIDTSGSSVTILEGPVEPFIIQSNPIPIPPEFVSLELRIEHLGDIERAQIWDGSLWVTGIRRKKTVDKFSISTSYYIFILSDMTNEVVYKVTSSNEVRDIGVLLHV